jgi:glycosyltransferase involved in cell wall biosynthesis
MPPNPKPLVTVLTPVFNGEAYLSECVEAVLAQTYKEFEYFIVDNRSQDRSLEIALRYAKLDSRVHVVENDAFLPQHENFNEALRFVSPHSKYCKFAFADDMLLPTCLEQMVAVAESDPEITLVSVYDRDIRMNYQGIGVVSGREACRLYLEREVQLFGSQNTVLFRASDTRSRVPFFRFTGGFEDIDTYFAILKAKKLGVIHQVLTFTRRDNVSTVTPLLAFEPHLPLRLLLLRRHGRAYLDKTECDRLWQVLLKEYLLFLGRNVLKRRDKPFWDYHKNAMARFNYELHPVVLGYNAFLALLHYALNPRSSLHKLITRARSRSAGNAVTVSSPGFALAKTAQR